MITRTSDASRAKIQEAIDLLLSELNRESLPEIENAFEQFASSILDYFDHKQDSTASSTIFSRELPMNIQRFAAAHILRILTQNSRALEFGNASFLAGSLFDRTFRELYDSLNLQANSQSYEKIGALTEYARSLIAEVELIFANPPATIDHVNSLRHNLLRMLNSRSNQPLLSQLLPASLTNTARISNLFESITAYANNSDLDRVELRDNAVNVCIEYEREAISFRSKDTASFLGGLARLLRSTVEAHFEYLEANQQHPEFTFAPISKKYPLEQTEKEVTFKVRITNDGTGPARDLRLVEILSDASFQIDTAATALGTIQAGHSFVLDIAAKVLTPSTEATLLMEFTWRTTLGFQDESTIEVSFGAQRQGVPWEIVELTEPYSLEAVTTGNELVGRRNELRSLQRLANLQAVGSGYIYGQKRVGKTSLANALAERLESSSEAKWIVISKGSGDYVGDDAKSTLRTLGDVLVESMKQRIPALVDIPSPDFANGLAPLSGFIDLALAKEDIRLLLILDEFDELPLDLLKRSDLSTSFFMPLRQISNKKGCGVLLVGGEGMQQIMNIQGDRLNKFRPIEVDYFDRETSWSDFAELIRRPVQDWLSISETALEDLFLSSAGNPYFAKLIASQLFSDMVETRSSDASEVDMNEAIGKTFASASANYFAHFWTDGLVEASDHAEDIKIVRRSVLIALGRSLRSQSPPTNMTIWDELQETTSASIEAQRLRFTLNDFIRRRVLVEDSQGFVSTKIPLFGSWLRGKGVGELLGDSREEEYLKASLQDEENLHVNDGEIMALCDEKFGHFRFKGRGIEPMSVRRWLDQFNETRDRRLMFQLLSEVRIYDESEVRRKMKEAYGIVIRNVRTVVEVGATSMRHRRDILISTLDDSAAKAGLTYCRLFASENPIHSDSVQPLRQLEQTFESDQEIQRLVLIDDFAGTGRTLETGLRNNLELLKSANARGVHIILLALVGFTQARNRLENFISRNDLAADVYFCDELGTEDSVFSETSRVFVEPNSRSHAKHVAESKGIQLQPRHPLGYGNTQAAVIFYQSCPNNVLPVLWSNKSKWVPLFPR